MTLLIDDLHAAWKHAVRALNCSENSNLHDTRAALVEVVARISQQLEFHETIADAEGTIEGIRE